MAAGDVETYCAGGVWHCRIEGEAEPFSSGTSKAEQVAVGAAEARRRGSEHLVKNAYGRVEAHTSYRSGSVSG